MFDGIFEWLRNRVRRACLAGLDDFVRQITQNDPEHDSQAANVINLLTTTEEDEVPELVEPKKKGRKSRK